jgi:hypothetical protein
VKHKNIDLAGTRVYKESKTLEAKLQSICHPDPRLNRSRAFSLFVWLVLVCSERKVLLAGY